MTAPHREKLFDDDLGPSLAEYLLRIIGAMAL
jgi:hypothetical protein